VTAFADLWGRLGNRHLDDMPPEVITIAGQCVLDWFACALAGAREPVVSILLDALGSPEGAATVLGTGRRLPIREATLVNGTAGHALDYDDASTLMGGHPTVPVLPAILALGEELHAPGADILAALVTGIEMESRVGAAIGPVPYARGWHMTSTLGVLGAAAAVARLLGLATAEAVNALGIAASQASGLKANFGTMTKPFHAGHAAERGLLAALLAARGMTAAEDALGSNQGLARALGSTNLNTAALEGDGWLVPQVLFKYHAACYLSHAAIESASSLRPGVQVDRIDKITISVSPGVLDVCAIPQPGTGLEAKFSLAAVVAFALVGLDTSATSTYSESNLLRPEVRRLISLAQVTPDPSLRTTVAAVAIEAGGESRHAEWDTGRPELDLDKQGRKLRSKFHGLVDPLLGTAGASDLAEAIASLGQTDDVGKVLKLALN
jgi:2-methylcitrate dehydratase PrpD